MVKLSELNTLRNQIFAGFTLTMVVVLAFAGVYIYGQVSGLLRGSAEKHIQQTAVQANGRLDALLDQVDSLTTQVATNDYVQKLLLKEADGTRSAFNERQSLLQIASTYMAYSTGIRSLELYAGDYRRLFPLDDTSLNARVSQEMILQTERMKGKLVWLGLDPAQPDSVLAMRRISLIDRGYAAGGYLAVHLSRDYFEMNEPLGGTAEEGDEYMLLADGNGDPILSDLAAADAKEVLAQRGPTVTVGGEELLAVRQQSRATGWTLLLLTPVRASTEGISVLRTAILLSIGIGAVAFLLLTLLLSTLITRPILKLMRTMRGARLGGLKMNPSPAPPIASLEIRELNHTYNQMVTHMNELIQVVYEKEITQSRTELKALQAQINPHFLFNTLEAFYWSLEDKGEEELASIVVAMSGLFRYVIGSAGGDGEWVTVRDELDHAQRYLQIMKMRLIDRLSWRIDADERLMQMPIPKLIIQPLVENAILHGVESRIGPGAVTIRVRSGKPGFATVSVIDDGVGMDEETLEKLMQKIEGTDMQPSAKKGAGVAMSNVQRRLKLYYVDADERGSRLRIESKVGVGTTVSFEITIPQGGVEPL
ncbi:sensor histidine kinase [Cohnella sp. REN36]|uniref:cache domain-containing sensor histidine kinase n=1 Tax=Cohnella sp. REN36 TaxID=2887347 RepID=UPI001D155649|nr:sensor histidine kinase [Cohnella sp. REN36]MCC3374434.1 histidine kinase [Cohnella sp. REN36]